RDGGGPGGSGVGVAGEVFDVEGTQGFAEPALSGGDGVAQQAGDPAQIVGHRLGTAARRLRGRDHLEQLPQEADVTVADGIADRAVVQLPGRKLRQLHRPVRLHRAAPSAVRSEVTQSYPEGNSGNRNRTAALAAR